MGWLHAGRLTSACALVASLFSHHGSERIIEERNRFLSETEKVTVYFHSTYTKPLRDSIVQGLLDVAKDHPSYKLYIHATEMLDLRSAIYDSTSSTVLEKIVPTEYVESPAYMLPTPRVRSVVVVPDLYKKRNTGLEPVLGLHINRVIFISTEKERIVSARFFARCIMLHELVHDVLPRDEDHERAQGLFSAFIDVTNKEQCSKYSPYVLGSIDALPFKSHNRNEPSFLSDYSLFYPDNSKATELIREGNNAFFTKQYELAIKTFRKARRIAKDSVLRHQADVSYDYVLSHFGATLSTGRTGQPR